MVAVFAAIAAVGRLAYHLLVWNKPQARPSKAATAPALPAMNLGKYVAPVLVVVAITLPFIPGVDRRIVDLAILMLTYIMLGWGLNIVVGLAGLLDLGYVAFYAVGAYAYALLATIYLPGWFGDGIVPWAFFITLPIAGILAALWGVILGFPVLRLRGDYLAIVTLAFGEIVRVILINWSDFTGGPAGIGNIPRPSFFGLPFIEGEGGFAAYFGLDFKPIHRIIFLYYVILVLALLTNFVTMRLRRLPVGAPGKHYARTRSPAARSASTPPAPSSRPSPWVPCSRDSPAVSLPRARASSAPSHSCSWSRSWFSPLSCSAA